MIYGLWTLTKYNHYFALLNKESIHFFIAKSSYCEALQNIFHYNGVLMNTLGIILKELLPYLFFRFFFHSCSLNRVCSLLTIFTKSYPLNTNHLSKYDFFLSKLTNFILLWACIVIFFAINSVSKVMEPCFPNARHSCSTTYKNVPAHSPLICVWIKVSPHSKRLIFQESSCPRQSISTLI